MLDSSHAMAGGDQGVLYRGKLGTAGWEWELVDLPSRQFIGSAISDIWVRDGYAWVCTYGGSIIKSDDYGSTWTTPVYADGSQIIYSSSFYDAASGWWVGYDSDWAEHSFIRDHLGHRTELPSTGYIPRSIAATSASEAWVSGDGGIYHTTDGGATWGTPQYSGNTKDIWVKDIGGVKHGWAVAASGKILRTTNGGATWQELSSPTLPSNRNADLAVYDDDHVAIAYGSGEFILYDGTTSTWTTDDSDSGSAKSSVAWAGGSDVAATCLSGSSIRSRHGSSWSATAPIPAANWKMRYLCTRLDAYATPLETVTIDGQQKQIPRDIKGMIDRAVNADAVGRSALTSGKWILDTPHTIMRTDFSMLASILGRIAGTANVTCDLTPTYIMNRSNVLGYVSSGSYHPTVHEQATWWRPFNTSWLDGAIGFYDNVSGDALTVRSPDRFIWSVRRDNSNAELGKAKAYLWSLNSSDIGSSTQYATQWIGLHSASTGALLTYTNTQPVRANFDQVESITTSVFSPTGEASTRAVRVAEIDLSNVGWPGGDTYLALHFPDDDAYSPGGIINRSPSSAAIQNAASSGITYGFGTGQCLGAELVHEGCTATAGNVAEPGGGNTPDANVIFPQYASGRSWAESAWMGIRYSCWMQTVLGDPLMAPFAATPTISFADPSPTENRHIAGVVSLRADATPYGSGTIGKVEFWAASGQSRTKIATDAHAPYECTWNTLEMSGGSRAYPDGDYTIEAVADQAGDVVGRAAVVRSVVVDAAVVPTVAISQPQNDDSVVTASVPVEAQPVGTPARVEFWLFGEGNPILAGQDMSAPYQCTISSSIAQDEVYDLQAVAYYDGATSTSYSARRRIVLVNDSMPVTSVSDLGSLADGTQVCLVNVPVVAGVSSPMDGAFYVEDASRTSGIRVVTTNASIAQGTRVTVGGVLHTTGTGVIERYITASKVWDLGSATCPQPLGMPNLHIGGQAPAGTAGITGGVGLYNTGLLVRTWGKVKYVGDNYVYIEDGSSLHDGNTREGPIIVPLDGSTIPATHPAVAGLRVYCGTLVKPGIGDYVSITGVSSTAQLATGEPIIRCVRLRSQADVTYVDSYARCAKKQYSLQSWDGYFVDINQNAIPVGGGVRMVSAQIEQPYGSYLKVRHYDPAISSHYTNMWIPTYISAATLLSPYQSITITGTSFTSGTDQWILADCIYLGGGSYGAMGAMSVGGLSAASVANLASVSGEQAEEPDLGGGAFRPWPYPSAQEIVASDSFKRRYNEVGAIGWALSQPDGSIVDLSAEATCGQWYGGRVFGLREWFEPIANGPNLFLYLDNAVAADGFSRDIVTIDIVGATLVTLSGGQRALVRPQAVYVYTDKTGRYMFPMPWPKLLQRGGSSRTDSSTTPPPEVTWPWKLRIAP